MLDLRVSIKIPVIGNHFIYILFANTILTFLFIQNNNVWTFKP